MNMALAKAMAAAVLDGDVAAALALADYLKEHAEAGPLYRLYVFDPKDYDAPTVNVLAPVELPRDEVIDIIVRSGMPGCEVALVGWTDDLREYRPLWDFCRAYSLKWDRPWSPVVVKYLEAAWAEDRGNELTDRGRDKFLEEARRRGLLEEM